VDRNITGAIIIVFLFLMLGLMARGWNARRRSQRHLPALAASPAELGEIFGKFSGLYVATTSSDNPLDRIAVRGLGFRSRVAVTIAATGIVLEIPGQDELFIPVSTVTGNGRATWAIDRVVEDDGLATISWMLGETAVTSSFRFVDENRLSADSPAAASFAGAMARLAVPPHENSFPVGGSLDDSI